MAELRMAEMTGWGARRPAGRREGARGDDALFLGLCVSPWAWGLFEEEDDEEDDDDDDDDDDGDEDDEDEGK